MNGNARDVGIVACICAVVITALIVTGSLDVLWLLLLLIAVVIL